MLLGTIASMAANVLFMLSTTYTMLLVARFLQGASNACVWTMCLCLVADNWPRDQLGTQMGKLVGFYPLGMMIGLPVGGKQKRKTTTFSFYILTLCLGSKI